MGSVTYQELINQQIGQIIKIVQYIEWNLLDGLEMDTFEEMTLGQIIKAVKKRDILHITAIEELESILEKRNDLVHRYFKRKDFEKHWNNIPFLENELRYLKNFNIQIEKFNEWLIKLNG